MNNTLTIDFPYEWDRILNINPVPGCTLSSSNSPNSNFAGVCTADGDRVSMPIVSVETDLSDLYFLTLRNLRNPDYEVPCNVRTIWTISIYTQ